MISDNIKSKILDLAGRYPKKESAIMPALMMVQKDNNNYITRDLTREVAELLGVPESAAYGVLTYYSMYNTKEVGKYFIQVDTNIPASLMGACEILKTVKDELGIEVGQTTSDKMFTLKAVEDLGSCGSCPVIQVNDTYYENMTPEKTVALIKSLREGVMPPKQDEYNWATVCNILLKNRGVENSVSIDTYKKNGGYSALVKALEMNPADIISEVKKSMLRGRGGAGFPTGVKWGFLPKNNEKPVYLICNADEGEPGTFKDRQIMEYDPHLLIEGMVISAHALKSQLGFIYIRGEFEWIAQILENAIEEARRDGKLNNFDIIVHRGAGAYVCGEETALIESIEGKRGEPRIKPPFPAVEGLYGCPTIVNNVETLASVPYIVENGAEAYRTFGPSNNNGFKIFGISGHVNKPGVYEYPMGIPFDELIEAAGGVKGELKAAIVGGLSVPILTANELQNLKMDYDSCIKHGTALGSGGVMVINKETSIPKIAKRTIDFYAHESCGRCAPCRHGSQSIKRILTNILDGNGKPEDLENILTICRNVKGVTICPTGEAFCVPIENMVKKFRSEFEDLMK
ncbi:MAG: NADH-quinone oxidoreductase subunit NuoF [Candidatus Delongbacteria bacterium]|nr:NADH-quinone oxidoreductase subunit NuoF [Candidatus Delongbacteria bacterium]